MDLSSYASPAAIIETVASQLACSPVDKEIAVQLDEEDELKHLRACFHIPRVKDLPPSKNHGYTKVALYLLAYVYCRSAGSLAA